MTKQQLLNSKIAVKDSNESVELQKYLFSIGIDYLGKKEDSYPYARYIYIDKEGGMTYGEKNTIFDNHAEREIKLSDVYRTYLTSNDVKKMHELLTEIEKKKTEITALEAKVKGYGITLV